MGKQHKSTSESAPRGAPRVWLPVLLACDVELSKHRQNVEKELTRIFRGAEFYLPVHDEVLNGKKYFSVLSEGYAYVLYQGTKEFDRMYWSARGLYVEGPVTVRSRSRVPLVLDSFIEGLKVKAKDSFSSYKPSVGDTVLVQHETLAGMEGEVSDVDHATGRAVVHIKLKSQEVVASVPFTNLEALAVDSWGSVMAEASSSREPQDDFGFFC